MQNTFKKARMIKKTFRQLEIIHSVPNISNFSTTSDNFNEDSTLQDLIDKLNEDYRSMHNNMHGKDPERTWFEGPGGSNLMLVLNAGGKLKFSTFEQVWREPASIVCCGILSLSSFTNTCISCGADYNSSGQRLAPRHMWGEETGEHWTDCY
jgi:hypothetical protein